MADENEIVLEGFRPGGKTGAAKEFSDIVKSNHVGLWLEMDGRRFEFTGHDAKGRRVYRDHTRY